MPLVVIEHAIGNLQREYYGTSHNRNSSAPVAWQPSYSIIVDFEYHFIGYLGQWKGKT